MQYSTEICVMRHAPPILQPLLFVKLVKISLAEFLGAMIQIGIMITRNPIRCPNNDIVSIIGSVGAPQVLKAIVISKKASMIKVYCQFGKAKVASSTPTKD